MVIHQNWDYQGICRAMTRAADDAEIRILQTWFPEEAFIARRRELCADDKKRFALQVLLIDPRARPPCSVRSPRRSRDAQVCSPASAATQVRSTAADLFKMKERIEPERRRRRSHGRRTDNVDLEVRFYSVMPFGPIYQIGNDVMYVGFYLSFGTSAEGPMIETKNRPDNRLWHKFHRPFEEAWEAETTRPFEPVGDAVGPAQKVARAKNPPVRIPRKRTPRSGMEQTETERS